MFPSEFFKAEFSIIKHKDVRTIFQFSVVRFFGNTSGPKSLYVLIESFGRKNIAVLIISVLFRKFETFSGIFSGIFSGNLEGRNIIIHFFGNISGLEIFIISSIRILNSRYQGIQQFFL